MPSIGRSDIVLNELKNGSVFDGFSLIKTRYFCMFFCILIHQEILTQKESLNMCDCNEPITTNALVSKADNNSVSLENQESFLNLLLACPAFLHKFLSCQWTINIANDSGASIVRKAAHWKTFRFFKRTFNN